MLLTAGTSPMQPAQTAGIYSTLSPEIRRLPHLRESYIVKIPFLPVIFWGPLLQIPDVFKGDFSLIWGKWVSFTGPG
ncbi:MAG: hypothetical protein M0R30_12635 [Methanoregula sp.]|jgi:hypothetical protein|uniref:hypothetical protein n=1 Tax=Methanoregula sp. TaxID=2052170 RepID=UPI0025DF687B|nr:hypothetical protein [Methanoregula sp.]MCK9632470.1 hypothetical protein [Methanoregula sp.]